MTRIKSRKPGKKAMVPRKWTTIFVMKKGTLWKLRVDVYGLGEAEKEWDRSLLTKIPKRAVIQDPERNVARLLKRLATKFPRNRIAKFPGNANKKKRKAKEVAKKASGTIQKEKA